MTKSFILEYGKVAIKYFCHEHEIAVPKVIATTKISHLGFYDYDAPDTLYINLNKCDKGFRDNHPMMIYETTIVGTIIHEFGHYLHYTHLPKRFTKHWIKTLKKEPFIHYRQMDVDEDIAEAIRLFILNPKRLIDGRPLKAELLKKYFNIDKFYNLGTIVKTYKIEKDIDIDKWEKFLI